MKLSRSRSARSVRRLHDKMYESGHSMFEDFEAD